MPKRKTYKRTFRRRKRRKTLKKTIRAVVRKAIKPTQTVIRKTHHSIPVQLGSNFRPFNLSIIAGTTNIFGTTSDDLLRNQAKWIKMNLDFTVRAGDEDEGSDLTVYLVSLKNDVKDSVYDTGTGVLNLTLGEDYAINNGAAFVNPRTFKIHKRWSILFPPTNASTNWPMSRHKRKFITMRPNAMIKNERGNWADLPAPQKLSHNYFLLAFNNNSLLDSESPTLELHCLNTYIA